MRLLSSMDSRTSGDFGDCRFGDSWNPRDFGDCQSIDAYHSSDFGDCRLVDVRDSAVFADLLLRIIIRDVVEPSRSAGRMSRHSISPIPEELRIATFLLLANENYF